jgi:hypothetical protein
MTKEPNLWKRFKADQAEQALEDFISESFDDDLVPDVRSIDVEICAAEEVLSAIEPAELTAEERERLVRLLRTQLERFTHP